MMNSKFRQDGAVLLTSLLILLILTLLAISSMQGTGLQQKMVSAQKEGVVSLEGAEAALRAGEDVVNGWSALPAASSYNWLYDQGNGPRGSALFTATVWSAANSQAITNPTDSGGVAIYASSPRFFIEYMGQSQVDFGTETANPNMTGYQHETGASTAYAFRIVGWSSGASGQSQRIVEEYYRREF